jgi:hypothetical protein
MIVVIKEKQKFLTSLMALHKLKTYFKYWHAKPRTPLVKDTLSCSRVLKCNSRHLAISRETPTYEILLRL